MIHKVKLNKEIISGLDTNWNIEYDTYNTCYVYYFYPDGFQKQDWTVVYDVDYVPLDKIINYMLDFATEDRTITGEFVKP